jgi:hypothetical protein
LGVSTNCGSKIPLSDQILRYVGGNHWKIATVLTMGDGRWIDELGILHVEEVCCILKCFGVA